MLNILSLGFLGFLGFRGPLLTKRRQGAIHPWALEHGPCMTVISAQQLAPAYLGGE
ncbi:unnamed protein product [Penicillium camemberti]|uniref:Str. FM013 n=1 Tax=Penicillium camemberti (strain FM 013) TaxID=1429867 RepID=A0A0G4NZB4_PENC3|nr:unnamed protein product [Penicillium camemberti]